MRGYLHLPQSLRGELKKPFGPVVETVRAADLEGRLVIAVGDAVTQDLAAQGITPKVAVYDGRCQRERIDVPQAVRAYPAFEEALDNPPGTLNPDVFGILEKAYGRMEATRIEVAGEEDLIALAAISSAPDDALVLYGQPNEGTVIVAVDQEVRTKAESIIHAMHEKPE